MRATSRPMLREDPGAPQTSAPHYSYMRKRCRLDLSKTRHISDHVQKSPESTSTKTRGTAIPRFQNFSASPRGNSPQMPRISPQKQAPRAVQDHPTIYYKFTSSEGNAAMAHIARLWGHLEIPFIEQRYAIHCFISNEDLLIPYLNRLISISKLAYAYEKCILMRENLVEQLKLRLYNLESSIDIPTKILQIRELTMFVLSLDYSASIILHKPFSLSKLLGQSNLTAANSFFVECLFSEEVVTAAIVATKFISRIGIIQIQTLINMFFDKCISWYTAHSTPNQVKEYVSKARRISALYFLFGLVADSPFDGNFLPALFIAHLVSLRTIDLKIFRTTLTQFLDLASVQLTPKSEVRDLPPNPPTIHQPSVRPKRRSRSLHAKTHKEEPEEEDRNVRRGDQSTEVINILTPSEAFHVILTDIYNTQIWNEFEQLCKELNCTIPLITVNPEARMCEVYRITSSHNPTVNFLEKKEMHQAHFVPSPFGVERIWLDRPILTDFSLDQVQSRSLESVIGVNPVQLLGEEEYDLLGYLNWPNISVKPFLIEGASRLMRQLQDENVTHRSKSLPAKRHKQKKEWDIFNNDQLSTNISLANKESVHLIRNTAKRVFGPNYAEQSGKITTDLSLEDLYCGAKEDSNKGTKKTMSPIKEDRDSSLSPALKSPTLIKSADLTALFLGVSSELKDSQDSQNSVGSN